MSIKNTDSKPRGYRLIILCSAALVLGSIIPLIVLNQFKNSSKAALLAGEAIGAAALTYVFVIYLLKK